MIDSKEQVILNRLTQIRKRHQDFPCGATSKQDECFLLSQIRRFEDEAVRFRSELATIEREHDALVEARATILDQKKAIAKLEIDKQDAVDKIEAKYQDLKAEFSTVVNEHEELVSRRAEVARLQSQLTRQISTVQSLQKQISELTGDRESRLEALKTLSSILEKDSE